MNTLGNIIWFVFGGIIIAIEYFLASLLLFITIIGIPFGIQTMKMAGLALWPFGKETREISESPGCLTLFMNVIWILIGGFWIAITHLGFAILFAITIIGFPFAQQHLKLAVLSLTPFGREIVTTVKY